MNFKYTWLGEFLSIIYAHFTSALLVAILWIIMIGVWEVRALSILFTVLSVVWYAISLFSASNTICRNDKKSYTKLSPIWYKGAVLSLGVILGNIIFAVIYSMIWKYFGGDAGLRSIWAVGGNVICIFWFAPYQELFSLKQTSVPVLSYIIGTAIPLVFCFLGYYLGYKNIDVTKKMGFLVYEKKKKK